MTNINPIIDDLNAIAHEHSAIHHIKKEAKRLKKSSINNLMTIQNDLVNFYFNKNNLAELYPDIKQDILNTYSQNEEFSYKKVKDDNGLYYGKNHIGFHLFREKINLHMAFLDESKILEQIQKLYYVMPYSHFSLAQLSLQKDPIFLLIDSLDNINVSELQKLLAQGRSFNIYIIFNLTASDAVHFFNSSVFVNNIHTLLIDKSLAHLVNINPTAYHIAANQLLRVGYQYEFII